MHPPQRARSWPADGAGTPALVCRHRAWSVETISPARGFWKELVASSSHSVGLHFRLPSLLQRSPCKLLLRQTHHGRRKSNDSGSCLPLLPSVSTVVRVFSPLRLRFVSASPHLQHPLAAPLSSCTAISILYQPALIYCIHSHRPGSLGPLPPAACVTSWCATSSSPLRSAPPISSVSLSLEQPWLLPSLAPSTFSLSTTTALPMCLALMPTSVCLLPLSRHTTSDSPSRAPARYVVKAPST